MVYLLQSRTCGEVLFPFLASHVSGSEKLKNKEHVFFDLNLEAPINLGSESDTVYIFISWVSISCFRENMSYLRETIKLYGGSRFKIISDNDHIEGLIRKDSFLSLFLLEFSSAFVEFKLDTAKVNYNLASPYNYLNSVFLQEPSVPVILNYSIKDKLFRRNLSLIKLELEEAFSRWSINSFVVEDSHWLEDIKEVDSFLNLILDNFSLCEWLVLSSISSKQLMNFDSYRFKLAGCRGIAIGINGDSEKIEFNQKKKSEIACIAYITISTSLNVKKLIFMVKTILLKTNVNHYVYTGKRNLKDISFYMIFYIISFFYPPRFVKLISIIKFNKNNRRKLFLKLKRLYK